MASIGKCTLAAGVAMQETTLTLANINFDFAIVKFPAPLEFTGLGNSLLKKRKNEAEDGRFHRAYGQRASEIAEDPNFNPTGAQVDGPFKQFVGADGRSIWAAATSRQGALRVHLLACMLARMWSGPQAVSIWSELVAGRKGMFLEQIQKEQFKLSTMTASQIEITTEELAEWDASARSASQFL
ncbi:uncharacterized protein TRUGW13939_02626 [Talaromyces rugulosus]|uniref:Uncharacterized protein n=1 Tax=Talaromyces rugulosus TaxID=121627 RepID=A0A7H8QNR4_TALRU|nr:uncharacterized protein TRUGW13939_02626 [Talaromyces rugulosus]QKX55532.1 hypothetical protein TRUGW13939_02626 [Talaromyces rugulosus]